MSEQLYAYNHERISTLAQRTAEAIEYLDATTSHEPSAADAIRTIRDIAHRLSTTWMPLLVNVGNDTSLTAWNAEGPGAASVPAAGTTIAQGFVGQSSAPPDGQTPAELAAEFQSVVRDDDGQLRFDEASSFNNWFLSVLGSMSFASSWGREPLETAELESGDSYYVGGFNASYNIGTLNMSIPKDGVNDPPTVERLYDAGIVYSPLFAPSDSGGFASMVPQNCDGVVVTVVALTSEPYFNSGQPSTLEVVGANGAAIVAGAVLFPEAGLVAAVSVGVGESVVVDAILQPEADQAVFETWSLVTPVNASGEIVGEPRLVQIPVAVECSSEEQFEQIVVASDGGEPTIIPTYGSTFVVMTDSEVEIP